MDFYGPLGRYHFYLLSRKWIPKYTNLKFFDSIFKILYVYLDSKNNEDGKAKILKTIFFW